MFSEGSKALRILSDVRTMASRDALRALSSRSWLHPASVAKRIVRRVQSQSAAYDIRHRFSLHFARATVCIRFFGTLGMQERVSDLMDSCLYPLHLGQAVSDDNALVSVAVVAVGFAVL